jgi:mono/diheme cytochrome c family protein
MKTLGMVCSLILIGATSAVAGGPTFVARGTVVPAGFVVTQFAVPVAVPQYTVPIAQPSYVQYGTLQTGYGTASTEALEDRIVAKVLKGLQATGTVKPLEAPPSLVTRSCVQCHGGATPKAGLDLSRPDALSAEQRLACVARLLTDDAEKRMPPKASGVTLSAEELGKVLQELSETSKGR